MTEHDDRDARSRYLWDPDAPADPEVVDTERALQSLRFDAASRPLILATATLPAPRRRVLWRVGVAMAASVLVIAGVAGFLLWRLAWPEGRPWSVTWQSVEAATTAPKLEVNRPLRGADTTGAHVEIARLGSMEVQPGTDLTLNDTRSRHHRLQMNRGTIDVRVWAPPGVVAVHTPAGDVIDLGCVFRLVVDDSGSHVNVQTGWVQLENFYGETLLPAGASSSMAPNRRPLVPLYDDATPRFRDGVRAIETATTDDARLAIAAEVLPDARRRDVVTLLMLANTTPGAVRRPLLDRAAELVPPPAGVSVDAILNGTAPLLWEWYGTLDLPPAKNWWRNWRDALPWPFSRR
jgi:hypothetical protein